MHSLIELRGHEDAIVHGIDLVPIQPQEYVTRLAGPAENLTAPEYGPTKSSSR